MPKIDPKAIESAYNELGAEAMMLKQVNLDLVPSPYEAKAKTWNLTRDIIRSSGHPKLPLSRQLTTRRMSLRIDKTGRREVLRYRDMPNLVNWRDTNTNKVRVPIVRYGRM